MCFLDVMELYSESASAGCSSLSVRHWCLLSGPLTGEPSPLLMVHGGCVASQGARHYGRCFLTAAVSPRASQIPNLRQILQRCRAQSPLFLRLIRQHCALQERSWLIWALWLIKLQYSCRAHLEVQKLRSTTYDDDDVHDEDDDAGQ